MNLKLKIRERNSDMVWLFPHPSLILNFSSYNLHVSWEEPCSPSYLGSWGGRVTWAWEAEAAVSHDHTAALQSGWQSNTLFQKNKYNFKNRRRKSQCVYRNLKLEI